MAIYEVRTNPFWFVLGTCEFDFVFVIDRVNSWTNAGFQHVVTFMRNLVDVINDRTQLGVESRLAIFIAHNNTQSRQIFSITQNNERDVILDRLTETNLMNSAPAAGSSTSDGFYRALSDARDHVRSKVLSRQRAESSGQQVLVLLKYDSLGSDHLQRSRDVVNWLMDARVDVIAVGRCIVCG